MNKPLNTICLLAATTALQLFAPVYAQSKPVPTDPTSDPSLLTAGFLSSHPDLRYRLLGLDEFKRGNFEDALAFFKRASYYADKPSQGMVAEMLWTGRGIAPDPVSAYAWMDLAAERGYAGFLGLRERYWATLNEAQRLRALEEGRAIYAKYGDEAAQPRIALVLRRERMRMTGSRTGNVGNLKIYLPGPDGEGGVIDGSKFYDDRYWNPKKYLAWHDSIWMKPRIGTVTVGGVEKVEDSSSRIPDSVPQIDTPEPATPQRDESSLGTHRDD